MSTKWDESVTVLSLVDNIIESCISVYAWTSFFASKSGIDCFRFRTNINTLDINMHTHTHTHTHTHKSNRETWNKNFENTTILSETQKGPVSGNGLVPSCSEDSFSLAQ